MEWIIFASDFQAVILDGWWEILRVLGLLGFREENQKGELVGTSFLAILMAGRQHFQAPAVTRTVSQLAAQQGCTLMTSSGKRIIFY